MFNGLEIEARGSQSGQVIIATAWLRAEEGSSSDTEKEIQGMEAGCILGAQSEVPLIPSSLEYTSPGKNRIKIAITREGGW